MCLQAHWCDLWSGEAGTHFLMCLQQAAHLGQSRHKVLIPLAHTALGGSAVGKLGAVYHRYVHNQQQVGGVEGVGGALVVQQTALSFYHQQLGGVGVVRQMVKVEGVGRVNAVGRVNGVGEVEGVGETALSLHQQPGGMGVMGQMEKVEGMGVAKHHNMALSFQEA